MLTAEEISKKLGIKPSELLFILFFFCSAGASFLFCAFLSMGGKIQIFVCSIHMPTYLYLYENAVCSYAFQCLYLC